MHVQETGRERMPEKGHFRKSFGGMKHIKHTGVYFYLLGDKHHGTVSCFYLVKIGRVFDGTNHHKKF